MGEKTKVILEMPNGETETLVLDTIIFGGLMGDGSEFPVGAYNGTLDIGKTTVSLVHILRAFIKIAEEQGLDELMTKRAMEFCMIQAMKREKENDPLDNVDLNTHMIKMRKDKINERSKNNKTD